MPPTDPYDREKVIEACAHHAWNASDRKDLEKHGIKNEAELREKIAQVIEHPDTRAFRGQTKMNPNSPTLGEQFGREIYVLRQPNEERGRTESIKVVLDPNINERGELRGGTVTISQRDPLARLERQEIRNSGQAPEIVTGGRPALREQESHRQVVEFPATRPPAFDPKYAREDLATARIPEPEKCSQQQPPPRSQPVNEQTQEQPVAPRSARPPAVDPKFAREEVTARPRTEQASRAQPETVRDSPVERTRRPVNDREAVPLARRQLAETLQRIPAALARRAAQAVGRLGGFFFHGISKMFESLFAPPAPKTAAQVEKEIHKAERDAASAEMKWEKYRYNTEHERIQKRNDEQQKQSQQERDDYRRREQGRER